MKTELNWTVIHLVRQIAPLAKANAEPGSTLAKAFALALADDWNSEADYQHGEALCLAAWDEWTKAAPKTRQHVLGGWNVPVKFPTREALLQASASRAESPTWYLNVHAEEGDEVSLFPDYDLDAGELAEVRVKIAFGATRERAIAGLKAVLAAVESRWTQAISLNSHEGLTVQRGESGVKA